MQVGVGMTSIEYQYETWPNRTKFYRRHKVETQLLASRPGRYRKLAWIVFLSGLQACASTRVWVCVRARVGFWVRIHVYTRMHMNWTGDWYTCREGVTETILLEGNVDTLTIVWKANGGCSRELDWSRGGYDNVFTLAGGNSQKVLRWRPTTRHVLFDDDHIVWAPFDTKHKQVNSMDIIVYVRVKRELKHFHDAHPNNWCAWVMYVLIMYYS